MYRISQNGQEPIIDVAQVQAIGPALRLSPPGRYHVDEHSADPFRGSKHVARAWGRVIHRQDGTVVTEAHPWLTE
jgi:hypothetical protein